MKKTVLTIFISAMTLVAASAQSMPSLFIPSDPTAAAVAGSSMAREATAFASADNACAMSFSPKTFAIASSYGMWAPETADNKVISIGSFFRTGERLTVGLSGSYLADNAMNITNANGAVTGSFSPKDIIARAAVSYLLTDALSLGVSGKFLSSSIAPDMSGTAFGGDVSLMFRQNSLSAALALCNLGSSISYGGDSYSMPAYLRAGAAYSEGSLVLSAEADYLLDGAFGAALGAEYGIADIAFLRAGYHYGAEDMGLPSFASAGLGVKFAGFEFNAAYLLASETLGGTMTFGLGYSF